MLWAGSTLAQTPPPKNPYLADSIYPLGHGGSHQQDSLPVAGPEDKSRTLLATEIQYTHTGPAFFCASRNAFTNEKKPSLLSSK